MKTILIPITNNFFVRTFLRTDASRIIKHISDVRVVFLTSREKLGYYRHEFGSASFVFDALPEGMDHRTERFFKFLETSSIHSRTQDMLQRWDMSRQKTWKEIVRKMPLALLKRVFWHLGRYSWWRGFIRRFFFFFSDAAVIAIFDRYTPDVLFCPTMIGRDYWFLREARRRGIKTVGMILSWDNLFSKTLLRVHPHFLLVQTQYVAYAAERFGDFPSGKSVVVGVPSYDYYFRHEGQETRAEFFKKIGADSTKKLLLYAFSGKAGFEIELEIIEILHEAIKKQEIRDEVQVLLRPYPRYDFPHEKLERIRAKYGFLIVAPVAHVGIGAESWEFDDAALWLLTNSLFHADLVITMYSTFFIEAAIFDKPLIGIAFDGARPREYWDSASRFFDWNHLADIKKLNGIRLVKSREEFAGAVNRALHDPSDLREGRRKIVAQQCEYTDGHSAERIARALLNALEL